METKTNVVLVHGAWADGSSWSRVIPILQKNGLNVVAAQLPLTSIDADVALTKNLLAALSGPVVLSVTPTEASSFRGRRTACRT